MGSFITGYVRTHFCLNFFFLNSAVFSKRQPSNKYLCFRLVGLFAFFVSTQPNLALATAPVGATSGAFNVSPSGAATYSIPIVVPPGVNGMVPKLTLNYKSQSGNGLLGMGWSMGGLSVVHHCGATFAIDGFKGGVNYDANDRFCLNGERLAYIGGNEYRTQHETWQKITFIGSASNPTDFIVKNKDGTVSEYKTQVLAAGNPSAVRLWVLSKVQDNYGNSLSISYGQDATNGDYWPTSISYNGNYVLFSYESRADITPAYEAGSVIKTMQRLKTIKSCTDISCAVNAGLVRSYTLTYDSNGAGNRSRLTNIQECGSDGVCLPPTLLTYQQGTSGFSADPDVGSYTTSMSWQNGGNFWGDVNGDGRADFVYLQAGTSNWRVISSNGTSSLNADALWGSNTQGLKWDTGDEPRLLDVNADGKADLVYYQAGTGVTWRVLLSKGDSFDQDSVWGTTTNGIAVSGGRHQYFFIDVDGDGKADIVYQKDGTATWRAALSSQGTGNTLGPDVALGTQSYGTVSTGGYHAHYWADVNGDGRADLIYQQDGTSTWRVMLSNGTSLGPDTAWGSNTQGIRWDGGDGPRFVDINADGKADLVYYQLNTTVTWRVLLSTGKSFVTDSVWATTAYVSSGYGGRDQIFFVDGDGDGKPDIVYLQNQTATWRAVLSSQGGNTTLGPDGVFGTQSYGTVSSGGYFSHFWADLNGDGKTDLIYLRDGTGTFKSGFSSLPAPDLLATVTNGLGNETDLSYKPLTDGSVYTRDSDASYPYQDLQNATYVVSQSRQSNGIGGFNTTSYQYTGLKRHHLAYTGLGFRKVRVDDPSGLTTYTYYNQTVDGSEGTVASNAIYAGSSLIKSVANTWTPISFGTRTLVVPASTFEQPYDLNAAVLPSTTTTYSNYDGYWSPQTITVTTSDGYSKTIDNAYNNDPNYWLLGKIKSSKVTATAPGQSSQYRESLYEYDIAYPWQLNKEIIEPNRATLTLTTSYGYDSFGNRTTKTVSGPDIITRTVETLTYDAKGQFVATRKNALNHLETYTYDARTGAVKTVLDANNITTTYMYDDGFGRKTKESRPGSPTTDIYYTCADGSVPASGAKCVIGGSAITRVRTVTSGAGENYAYYDILGREVQTNKQGFGGNWIYKQTYYDSLGRVSQVTHPYFSSETAHCITYIYDILGRVLSTTLPGPSTTDCSNTAGGRVTTTTYNGLSTTTSNPLNQVKTMVKNSQGQDVTVTDNAGTTTYTYDPFGNLTNVAKSYDANASTTMTYDIRGRKISMNDPDMGTWTYKYNVLNELIEQKDAIGQTNGRVISMTYDVLGRMQTRVLPNNEGTATWTYDTAAYGKGKLQSVSNPNATETYVYDSLSRLSSQTTSIGGISYTTSYTYDAYGKPLTLTYPTTGFTLYNIYDPYGHLTEVHKDTATGLRYWKATGADAHDRLINETYGNGLTTTHVYSHQTEDLQSIQTGSGGTYAIQNLNYIFDALGNLSRRVDVNNNLTEDFYYDTLNRLTSVSGPANKTYQYADNGNITYKSDTGFYFYPTNGVRPHGVTSTVLNFTPTNYAYDANGNMTSGGGRSITYASFNKPKTISYNGKTDTFTYDANDNRIIKSLNTPASSTIYIGNIYEKYSVGTTVYNKHYIYAGASLVAVYDSTAATTRYFHTDHIGSIDTISNETGQLVQRLSYDAHGKRRNPNGTDATSITAPNSHGYTAQEHDDEVSLINLNAREYDPYLGRFLSPDPLVPNPRRSQTYNRYSYALNNPLRFIDPTGYEGEDFGGGSGSDFGSDYGSSWWDSGPVYSSGCSFCSDTSGYGGSVGTGNSNLGIWSNYSNNSFDTGYSNNSWNQGGLSNSSIYGDSNNFGFSYLSLGSQSANTSTSLPGMAADIAVGFTPAGVAADIYGAFAGKTFFGSQELSWWERGLGLIPGVSEAIGMFRGGVRTVEGVAKVLPDSALVCRGGTCTADKFINGRGVTMDANGKLNGVSVNSAPDKTIEQLTVSIHNKQVGVTTVGDIRRAGGDVLPSPSSVNPNHCTLCGITPQEAESLFTPTVRNPNVR